MTGPSRVRMTRLALIAALLGLVEIAPRVGWVDPLAILPVSAMVGGAVDLVSSGDLWAHLLTSGVSIVIAFVASVLLGVTIGYGLWRMPALLKLLSPYLVGWYGVPVFAFYPVLVMAVGFNRVPGIAIAIAWAVVAVIMPTVEGLDRVHRTWIKVGTVYGLGRIEMFWFVQLRAALPQIASGMKLAVTYSILGVIAAELILGSQGLGHLIAFHFNNFEVAKMWGATLIVIAITVVLNQAADWATRPARFGR